MKRAKRNPHRLAAGGQIDRGAPLNFSFNGSALLGYRGDLIRREALLAGNAPEAPLWVDSVLTRPDLAGTLGSLDWHALPFAGDSLASMLGH